MSLMPSDSIIPSRDVIRRAPKVLLHDHLDGGLRPETILELAGDVGHDLPVSDPEGLQRWFTESADSGFSSATWRRSPTRSR